MCLRKGTHHKEAKRVKHECKPVEEQRITPNKVVGQCLPNVEPFELLVFSGVRIDL